MPPVMIGAFRPKMLRLTARYADEWNVSSTGIEEYLKLKAQFEEACAAEGRDPASVQRSWGGGCVCAPTEAEARTIGGDRYTQTDDDYNFVGTPEQVAAQMRPFVDAGVTRFMVDCGGWPRLTTLELLVRKVLPALR
jgi:alkanesulfonate monooxygenase SsuD/methylene tetrahydromethanopterin reductase-like flavin-dependent oxidoreductase (luciferase family)